MTSGRKGKKKKTTSKMLTRAIIAVYTVGSLVIVSPTAEVNGIIPLLHTIIISGSSDTKHKKLPAPPVSIKNLAPSFYNPILANNGKDLPCRRKSCKALHPVVRAGTRKK